jgi:hypothetical protein
VSPHLDSKGSNPKNKRLEKAVKTGEWVPDPMTLSVIVISTSEQLLEPDDDEVKAPNPILASRGVASIALFWTNSFASFR